MGVDKNTRCGFGNVNGQYIKPNNPTVRDLRPAFQVGERHESVVKVRNDSVSAYIDGALVINYPTDYARITGVAYWKTGKLPLGVGTWNTKVAFDAIELVEITGHGQRIDRPN